MRSVFVAAYFILCGLTLNATGQSKDAVLKGNIFDRFGAVITNVQIMATAERGKPVLAVNKEDGTYLFRLPEGVYALKFDRGRPFKPFIINEFQVVAGAEMRLDVSLVCENCEVYDHSSAAAFLIPYTSIFDGPSQ